MLSEKRSKRLAEQFALVNDTIINGIELTILGRVLEDHFPSSDWRFIDEHTRVNADSIPTISIHQIASAPLSVATFLSRFEKVRQSPVSHSADQGIKLQYVLTYPSLLGNVAEYEECMKEWEGNRPVKKQFLRQFGLNGAIGKAESMAYILRKTKNKRLVMFNENHFYPNHCILLTKLLPELQKEGYTHLALEAVSQDSLLNEGELPKLETGFYTREQCLYQLIKTAQKLGFVIVGYDADAKNGDRELRQAKNLYEKKPLGHPQKHRSLFWGEYRTFRRTHLGWRHSSKSTTR